MVGWGLIVAKVQEEILAAANTPPRNLTEESWEQELSTILFSGNEEFKTCVNQKDRLMLPGYYRKMYAKFTTGPVQTSHLKNILIPLFRNNLSLSTAAVSGEGAYIDCFLCVDVDDEDLPWDVLEEPRY
ncbi:hypothetical protein IFR05_015842 [Cadophora sp. M221]|nr:hypothetical protein IFR05_015842 [Cadophora sp. M221]